MDEASGKLKGVFVKRCTEDKWPADVVDCYANAQKREDLRACRTKLPAESSQKLQKEEMEIMVGAGFGGRPHGMGGSGMEGHPGMGAPGMGGPGMEGHPGMGAPTTPPDGSGMAPPPAPTPPTPPAAGSAK